MSDMLKPYEEYKEVNAVWLDKIPSHWDCEKLGMNFIERRTKVSDRDYPPLSVTKKGVVPQLETAAKSNDGDNRKLVLSGDFVINSRSDRKGSSGLSKLDGSVSLINIVLEPKSITPNYSHYLLKSYDFIEEYYRNGRGIVADLWTTRYWEMRNILIPIPSLSEQEQIVSYLDSLLAKINKFIKVKKRLTSTLKEQKQSFINEAVTKGIHPDVKMKQSGVDWIGDIPEGWETIRCKYLFREIDTRSTTGLEKHLSMSQKYGLIPDEQLIERRLLSENYIGGKVCSKADLVLNRLKAHLGVFALAPQTGVISPDYTVLRPNEKVYPIFAETVLKSQKCRSELRIRVRGIVEGFWRLYTDDFNNIVLPIPKYEEQVKIMNHINEKSLSINTTVARIEKEIELITEYKTRLISDVVTGKVDVCEVEVEEIFKRNSDIFEADEELDADKVVDSEE
jgi:type I restriction enzyme S subunit